MTTSKQITIVCLLYAKPETAETVLDELTRLARLTRMEPGNINYLLHRASADKNLFIIYENWKDQASHDGHMNQPHLKAFLKQSDMLLQRPIDGKFCSLVDCDAIATANG